MNYRRLAKSSANLVYFGDVLKILIHVSINSPSSYGIVYPCDVKSTSRFHKIYGSETERSSSVRESLLFLR